MKNSTKIFILGNLILIISFMAIAFISVKKAKENKFSGNGKKVSKFYYMPRFTQVNLQSFDYELIQSEKNYVEIIFDENGFGMFDVRVSKEILTISEKNGAYYFQGYPKIKVFFNKLDKIKAQNCRGIIGTINADNLEIISESFSNIDINYIGKNLSLIAESNAEIKVKGIVKNLKCYGESLAKFYLYELSSEKANVELNNNSYAEVYVIENLIAKANSLSEIKYKSDNYAINTDFNSKNGGNIKLEK